ncbi:hypothetical protein M501DRAFT_990001 [Patellaria atrata CBS 101060]|uniref:Subtelomeric hrmA-associated cluster protein AFUB-079030/YDR124W-like helical bundle domain-containing protein n=1 Tax=Patellaria atrata CBS 101060 TaxID=1346257 RepID=A0A9P4SF27_9PEZI|nr:hypothetical protein M501DRAFT_990001 [Patellaria atrata CBS 101060]
MVLPAREVSDSQRSGRYSKDAVKVKNLRESVDDAFGPAAVLSEEFQEQGDNMIKVLQAITGGELKIAIVLVDDKKGSCHLHALPTFPQHLRERIHRATRDAVVNSVSKAQERGASPLPNFRFSFDPSCIQTPFTQPSIVRKTTKIDDLPSPALSGSRKRQRLPSTSHTPSTADEDCESGDDIKNESKTLAASKPEEVIEFMETRLKSIGQLALKAILKIWIKVIEPNKQSKYPYTSKSTGPNMPPWWPPSDKCRFKEPDHLSKSERIILAIHVLRYRGREPWTTPLEDATAQLNLRTENKSKALRSEKEIEQHREVEQRRADDRRKHLDELYAVAKMEEDFVTGGSDEIYGYTLSTKTTTKRHKAQAHNLPKSKRTKQKVTTPDVLDTTRSQRSDSVYQHLQHESDASVSSSFSENVEDQSLSLAQTQSGPPTLYAAAHDMLPRSSGDGIPAMYSQAVDMFQITHQPITTTESHIAPQEIVPRILFSSASTQPPTAVLSQTANYLAPGELVYPYNDWESSNFSHTAGMTIESTYRRDDSFLQNHSVDNRLYHEGSGGITLEPNAYGMPNPAFQTNHDQQADFFRSNPPQPIESHPHASQNPLYPLYSDHMYRMPVDDSSSNPFRIDGLPPKTE